MAATANFTIKGGKALDRALGRLDKKICNKVAASAVRKGGKPIIAAMRRNVPTDTGLLKASLGLKFKRYRGSVVAIIGPRLKFKSKKREGLEGSKAKRQPALYAHLVEFGVKPHMLSTTKLESGEIIRVPSHHPGFQGKQPMTRGFESSTGQAMSQVIAALRAGIETYGRGR